MAAKKKLLFPELSYKVMEAVYEVHNQMGPEYAEKVYENALAIELATNGLPFERQKPINLDYKGTQVGEYYLDLVIDSKIILELKAVTELNDLHKQQLLSYLRASQMKLGILINFGSKRVQQVRIAN